MKRREGDSKNDSAPTDFILLVVYRYFGSYEERVAFSAVPSVLKRGIVIDGHEHHKGRKYDTVTIAAPVILNEVRGNMAVVVRNQGKHYYKIHRIVMPNGSQFTFENKKEILPEGRAAVKKTAGLSPMANISTNTISHGQAERQEKLSDLRKSLKPASSISEENRWLIEENEKYKAIIAKLNRHIYAIQKKVVDPKGVHRLAKSIRAEFKSKYSQADLEQRLTDLFDYIANEKDVDFGEITHVAAEIAKDVISQGALNEELAEEYKPLRDYLKTARIQLTSLQKSEMVNQYGSYAAFRQKTAGKIGFYVKDGIKLDEKWGELCEQWPKMFSKDTHEAEMPQRLIDVIEQTDPYYSEREGINR